MTTVECFSRALTGVCGVCPGDHVLAAVSGGADSVALLLLLCEVREALRLTVSCAHMEHGIRGEASVEDMRFVRELCRARGVAFYAERADVTAFAKENGLGLEEAARTLRHAFLERTADAVGAGHIALAHHAQDQAETVLMHASRGSDVRGLCAMQARRGRVIRPLLGAMPQELRAYLRRSGQRWREDETNGDLAYARNRIRAQALPALMEAYPGAVNALCRLARAAQRDEAHFDALIRSVRLTRRALVDGVALRRSELAGLDAALLGRVLVGELALAGLGAQDAGCIDAVAEAIVRPGCAVINLTGGAHAHVGESHVCLTCARANVPEIALSLCGETVTPYGVFTVRPALDGEHGDGLYAQAVDESLLAGCVVTGRRKGDALIPFGRHSPVKLKKLMIDAGIERPMRNSLPVIRAGEDILWVVGLRPSQLCAARGGRRLMITCKSGIS